MVSINKDFILDVAKEILSFHSPSGFCFEIMEKVETIVGELGYNLEGMRSNNHSWRKWWKGYWISCSCRYFRGYG